MREKLQWFIHNLNSKQQQVTIDLKILNIDNIRYLNERLRGLLSGTQNWGSIVKLGNKRTCPCTRIESSKACHSDIYENIPRCKIVYLQMDNRVALSYIKKMVGYPRQGSFRIGQESLGLLDRKWDHDYCGIYNRYSQCRGRFSFPISYGLERMETKSQNIQNDLQGSRDSRYQSLSIRCQCPYHENQILSTLMEKPESLCTSPFCLIGEFLRKVQLQMTT